MGTPTYMHMRREGTGRPLLLVHGISHLHNWDPIWPALVSRRDVIAVDLPGFGKSEALPGEVSIATLTDAVADFIADHGLDGVDVVGSSMGARIALELARRGHPGSVVALDPGGFWSDTDVRIFAATLRPSIALVRRLQPVLPALVGSAAGRTALLLQFSARPWRLDPTVVLAELRNFAASPSLDAALDALADGPREQSIPPGSLRAPLTIGWGRQDRVTFPRQAKRAAELIPDADLHWFDSCGHFPHWDAPEETVRLLLERTGGDEAQPDPPD